MKDTDFCGGYDYFIYELIFFVFCNDLLFLRLFEFLFINYNLKNIYEYKFIIIKYI